MVRSAKITVFLALTLPPWWIAFSQAPAVEIIGIEVNDDAVVVTYDLRGDSTEDYEARLYLILERQPGSPREIKAISGDIAGRLAGKGRRIIWAFWEDLAAPGPGEAYKLRVVVEPPGPWYTRWYTLTGGGLALGALAMVLFDKDGGVITPPPTVPQVPMPPARP